MGVDGYIGSLKPMLQLQVTPLQWGVGFCFSIRHQKIGLRLGPFAVALSGFKWKFNKKFSEWN